MKEEMAKRSQVTRQVRSSSEGTNCLEAQASKGKVGHIDFRSIAQGPKAEILCADLG